MKLLLPFLAGSALSESFEGHKLVKISADARENFHFDLLKNSRIFDENKEEIRMLVAPKDFKKFEKLVKIHGSKYQVLQENVQVNDITQCLGSHKFF